VNNFRIVEAAMAADAERITLVDGKVVLTVRDQRIGFQCSDAEYLALWDAAQKLELSDNRAMAPHLLPELLRDSWTVRVYVGPNVFGKTNVLLEPLPTKFSDTDLSSLGFHSTAD
jgi:hypothetical protein